MTLGVGRIVALLGQLIPLDRMSLERLRGAPSLKPVAARILRPIEAGELCDRTGSPRQPTRSADSVRIFSVAGIGTVLLAAGGVNFQPHRAGAFGNRLIGVLKRHAKATVSVDDFGKVDADSGWRQRCRCLLRESRRSDCVPGRPVHRSTGAFDWRSIAVGLPAKRGSSIGVSPAVTTTGVLISRTSSMANVSPNFPETDSPPGSCRVHVSREANCSRRRSNSPASLTSATDSPPVSFASFSNSSAAACASPPGNPNPITCNRTPWSIAFWTTASNPIMASAVGLNW